MFVPDNLCGGFYSGTGAREHRGIAEACLGSSASTVYAANIELPGDSETEARIRRWSENAGRPGPFGDSPRLRGPKTCAPLNYERAESVGDFLAVGVLGQDQIDLG